LLTIAVRVSKDWLLRLLVVLAAVWAASGSVAYAQTTGTLQGNVFDEDSLEIPGVSVTIASPTMIGGEQSTETD
jgi:hypothetical protein